MGDIGRYIPEEIPKEFWKVIDNSEEQKEKLMSLIEEFSEDELQRFCWNYEEAVGQIATLYYEMTAFSEDSIEDICSWVVAKGKTAYTEVWDKAEDLITTTASPYGRHQSDPGLLSLALEVYRKRFGKEVPLKKHDRFV